MCARAVWREDGCPLRLELRNGIVEALLQRRPPRIYGVARRLHAKRWGRRRRRGGLSGVETGGRGVKNECRSGAPRGGERRRTVCLM